MIRFSSLGPASSETRHLLRRRFARYLPGAERHPPPRTATTVSDESVLNLLLSLEIDFANDEPTCRGLYEANRAQHASALSFDELVPAGLLRLLWGRMHARIGVSRLLPGLPEEVRASLEPVIDRRYKRRFTVGADARNDPTLRVVVTALTDNPDGVHHIDCPSPSWVAARLWERTDHLDPDARLRFCVDRWALLDGYSFAPIREWSELRVRQFREAAFRILQLGESFFSWAELRTRLTSQLALSANAPLASMETYVPAVPAPLLDRIEWLERQEFDRVRDEYETCEDLWALVNLLVADALVDEQSRAPHPVMQSLVDLAVERPELLSFLVSKARYEPVLMADLVLEPRTAALACVLVAEWQSSGGAWDRELVMRDDRAVRAIAFGDATAVMSYHLGQGTLAPSDVAALLSWMYERAGIPTFPVQEAVVDDDKLEAVRFELTGHPSGTLTAVADALKEKMSAGLGSAPFAAALEVIGLGSLIGQVPPEPFVAAYVQSLRAGDYSLGRTRLDRRRARTLVEMALRCDLAPKRRFFFPLEIPVLLAEGDKPKANPFIVHDQIVRAVRAHVRVLSRAIAAWEGTPPQEVVDALVAIVHAGAIEGGDRERIAAFAARYETAEYIPRDDGPLAWDLGAALRVLDDAPREQLLRALLETTEPLLLAHLATVAPLPIRPRIQKRISELTPSVSDVSTLTEIQARIGALLSSGSLDAAARFIEIEKGVGTLGPVPGRALARLRAEMQLRLLKGEFDQVANAVLSADLTGAEHNESLEALDFYKALAQFLKEGGDRTFAEQTFERLHKRHSGIAAYGVNLFAVRASKLLAGDLFGHLEGQPALEARRLLREDVLGDGPYRTITDDDRSIHGCNRALLLLATGQADRAKDVLDGIPHGQMGDRVAAYTAVALSRLGRHAESSHALKAAALTFGDTEAIRAARSHIKTGEPYDAKLVATPVEDYAQGIREALVRLSNMDPLRQALLFHGPPDAFVDFVVPRVRGAAAKVMALVPMMKRLGLNTHEDHVTAVIQAILAPRLEMFGWTVVDQPLGGHTAKGNPGRRDLVIKKEAFELAVIEAVFCREPVTHARIKDDLISHFKRLLAYSTCQLFFHVTYSAVDNPGTILSELKVAAEAPPDGFQFLRGEDLEVVDSGPAGFVARYRSALHEVKVVFLIVDLRQAPQKDAAQAAAAST
jgi:hypothetical protein